MRSRNPLAKDAGLTEAQIAAMQSGNGGEPTAAETAALDFADRFVTDPASIDDRVLEGLRAHYSDAELVELGWAVAMFAALGRLKLIFDVE